MTTVQSTLYDGRSISSLAHGMTDADRRWLTREVKAGRVYRRRGLRDGFRPFGNVTYWISANRAADLDAECDAAARRLLGAAALDEAVSGRFANALHLQQFA